LSGRSDLRAADVAWLALTVGVVAYEAHASRNRHDWELLSEAADRYRSAHPVLTHGLVLYMAAHLTRTIPRRVDPLCRLAARFGR